MATTSRSRRPKLPYASICSGTSCGGSIDCDDLSLQWPERKEETRGFGGGVCTDEAKSTRDRPPHAGGPPNPVLFGLENGSSFPNTPYAAIFGQMFGVIWGMSIENDRSGSRTRGSAQDRGQSAVRPEGRRSGKRGS